MLFFKKIVNLLLNCRLQFNIQQSCGYMFEKFQPKNCHSDNIA